MTNILIVYETIEPGNIETRKVFKLLEKRGVLQSRGLVASQIQKHDLAWCDILLLVRSTSSIEKNLSFLAKKMGKFVILFLDDDFLSLSDTYGVDGSGYRKSRHNCLKAILHNTDCLLAVNKLLAEKYIVFCQTKRFAVTNTIVEHKEIYKPSKETLQNEKVKIALYVNDGSQTLFNEILKPSLHLLSQRYQDRISIYLMALHPDLSEFKNMFDVHFVPHMPYAEFKHYLGTKGFDIGLAPLTDIGFSKYKYFNKYIEYTLAGIPAIYSDCPLYRLVVQDEYNGLVCDNSPEGWYQAMSRMIENMDLRKKLIDNAQHHLCNHFHADAVLDKLLADIPELTTFQSPRNATTTCLYVILVWIKIQYCFFRMQGWVFTAYSMLKKGNVRQFRERFEKRILKI